MDESSVLKQFGIVLWRSRVWSYPLIGCEALFDRDETDLRHSHLLF
jgi:hypothetical protein